MIPCWRIRGRWRIWLSTGSVGRCLASYSARRFATHPRIRPFVAPASFNGRRLLLSPGLVWWNTFHNDFPWRPLVLLLVLFVVIPFPVAFAIPFAVSFAIVQRRRNRMRTTRRNRVIINTLSILAGLFIVHSPERRKRCSGEEWSSTFYAYYRDRVRKPYSRNPWESTSS